MAAGYSMVYRRGNSTYCCSDARPYGKWRDIDPADFPSWGSTRLLLAIEEISRDISKLNKPGAVDPCKRPRFEALIPLRDTMLSELDRRERGEGK